MPAHEGESEGVSALEIETQRTTTPSAEKRSSLVKMLIPTSPHVEHRHAPLYQDDDLDDEAREISDNFEIDGESDDEEEDVDAHGVAQGTATPAQVAVNIFISFVGAGLLGLPYAFSRSGWLLGTVSLALVSAGNLYCMLLLVKIRKRLEADGITGIKGYGCVGREVIGPKGELLVNICLVVSQAGFATAYLIFIAANIQSVTSGQAGRAMIIYLCVPILSLLVQFRDMKKLSPFSLIADVANITGLSAVLFQDFEFYTHDDNIRAVDFSGLVYITSICIYSLEGVGLVLPLESSCKDRGGFPKLLTKVIFGIFILMAFFGTCGYVSFGNDTVSPISLNLKGESAAFVQMALCLALYFTYPMMMFPVSDVLEDLLFRDTMKPATTYWPSRSFRCFLVLTTATIAYTLPNFGKFLELVGASICTLLGFILPCFFHLKVFGRSELSIWQWMLDVVIIGIGIFFGVVGTFEAVMKLMEDDAVVGDDASEL
ncbi:hypothetical protein ACHAWO_003298 [Cyclotella atomus]|uniref:Amino acid transporter transmembrane domain-containing protein n=1 Tax=Cyclotella atomus TaxID=382360 RepID=A0ABD3Q5C8_9STRA